MLHFICVNLLTKPIMTFRLFAKFFGVYRMTPDAKSVLAKSLKNQGGLNQLQIHFLNKFVSSSIHEVLCVQFVEIIMKKIHAFVSLHQRTNV